MLTNSPERLSAAGVKAEEIEPELKAIYAEVKDSISFQAPAYKLAGMPTGTKAFVLMQDASGNTYKSDTTGLFSGGGGTPSWEQTLAVGPDLTSDVYSNAIGTSFYIDSLRTLDLASINTATATIRTAKLHLRGRDDATEGVRLSYTGSLGESFISYVDAGLEIHTVNQLILTGISNISTQNKIIGWKSSTTEVGYLNPGYGQLITGGEIKPDTATLFPAVRATIPGGSTPTLQTVLNQGGNGANLIESIDFTGGIGSSYSVGFQQVNTFTFNTNKTALISTVIGSDGYDLTGMAATGAGNGGGKFKLDTLYSE